MSDQNQNLRVDAINVTPVDFDFSEGYGETWDVVYPDVDGWNLEQCREYLDDNGVDFPDPDPFGTKGVDSLAQLAFDLGIEGFNEREEDGETRIEIPRDLIGGSTFEQVQACAVRARIVEAIDDEEVDGIEGWRDTVRYHMTQDDGAESFQPMMSYYYPLPGLSSRMTAETAQEEIMGTACVIALVNDEPVLALAGGGMDLSPSICKAYVLLGYYPPLHFAEGLPRLGKGYGNGMSRRVVEACVESARIAESWAKRARERLEEFLAEFPPDAE